MVEAIRNSEALVILHQSTQRYNPEDIHLRTHRRENLKSYLSIALLMETVCTSETSIDFCAITRCSIPEDSRLHSRRRGLLKMSSAFPLFPVSLMMN
jgi:hypothetical protein